MNILQTILGLIPATFNVDIPAETFTLSLGSFGNFKVATPSFSVVVTKG
jgi:hypothetical protein